MASSLAPSPQVHILPFEWKIDGFKSSMKGGPNCHPVQSPLYAHESLPGLTWQFTVKPRVPYDRFGIDLHLKLIVCELGNMNSRQKYSDATAANAGFKAQMKGPKSITSLPSQMELRSFGHASPSHGKANFAAHAAVEPFCDDEGALLIIGEIFLQKDASRHTEFARQMFASQKHTDFSIIVENEAYRLHKYLLEDVSPVFREMISKRRYKETDASVSQQAMISLLQHIYGYQLCFKDLPILACEVLALIDKFQVDNGLKHLCMTGLRTSITSRNVISSYVTGVERSFEALKTVAIDVISNSARTTFWSPEWITLKEQNPNIAMAICDQLFARFIPIVPLPMPVPASTPPALKKRKVETVADTSSACATPPVNVDTIYVRWQIPGFRQLLHATGNLTPTSVSKQFTHENLPGIAIELIVYTGFQMALAVPPGPGGSCVSVALRHVSASFNKSAATAPKSGFSLAFGSPAPLGRQLPAKELPLQIVRCGGSEVGIACFANQTEVDRICADDGSVVLFGKILIEAASCRQIVHSRKLFESGDNSDFKVKFGPEIFNAHKFVLSSSPVISGMFGLSCSEMDKKELTIRADTTAEAVKAMLQFWYGDPLSFDGLQDLSSEVLLLAAEYQDWDLVKICEAALVKLVKADNVFNLAAIAFLHNTPQLADATSEFLAANFDALLRNQNAEWTQLKENNKKLAIQIAEAVICR